MTIVRVSENFELKSDSLQWQVQEFCEVKNKETGESEWKWKPLNSYHSSVSAAVRWIKDYIPRKGNEKVHRDLASFLEEMRKIDEDIAKHARKMDRAAKALKDADGGSREE